MYVIVKLLKGFPKPLIYKIPPKFYNQVIIGKIVDVPLKNKITPAIILNIYKYQPQNLDFEIKTIKTISEFPADDNYYNFIKNVSHLYFVKPIIFYKRIKNFLLKKNIKIIKKQNINYSDIKKTKNIVLTREQKNIINNIKQDLNNNKYSPSLLHGVTNSGKTEIYKKLIIQAFKKNKSIIFLLPEVALSIQFEQLFKKELPSKISVIGFHSATSEKNKKLLWQKLLKKEPILIIGVHLPIFLPINNLGLIIVDEEHEIGFQEKKHPKINSKEIAIWRAKFYKIPILLGSATPSLNSLYNLKTKNWKSFKLKKRFAGNFPKIELVFLKNKKRNQQSFWVSKKLEKAIKVTLAKKEQVIIYLNRRGYSFFIQCKNCGFTFQCPNCSVSLTPHSIDNNMILRCHYCNYKENNPQKCPKCNLTEKNFIKKGIGTQQAVKILTSIFPEAKIERADLDSTSKKRNWNTTVEKFENGKIDILVGTQLITKGYHFPKVTLVGILWADLNLHIPLFNSNETCLQKLIQVAGRAGRQNDQSRVIAQAINDHEIFKYLNEKNYIKFCNQEMKQRKITKFPPFGRFVQIELKNINVEILEKESFKIYNKLKEINKKKELNIKILGPSKPIVYKIQKTENRQIFLKTNQFKNIYSLLKNINFEKFNSKVYIVPTA